MTKTLAREREKIMTISQIYFWTVVVALKIVLLFMKTDFFAHKEKLVLISYKHLNVP